VKNPESQVQRLVHQFPDHAGSARMLEPWLRNLVCKVHSARWFECFANWKMLPRCLANDVLFYVMRGKGTAKIGSVIHPLRPGMCLHFSSGVEHEAGHDPRHPLHVLVMHYTALADFSLELSDFVTLPECFDLGGDPVVAALLQEACRLTAPAPGRWQNSLDAIGLVVLFRLLHHHGQRIHPLNAKRLSDLSRLSPALRKMRESCAAGCSVEEYAALANLSPPQFRRIFRRATSMSPNQFLQSLRLQKACALLRRSQATIESISSTVGYSDPSFFSRTFKKAMGMSPGAYRRRMDFME